MTDVQTLLIGLRRPCLLIEAARYAAPQYRREAHLRRHLATPALPGPRQAAMRLICVEQEHEEARRARQPGYSAQRHIEVLVALMGEAAAIAAEAAQAKASATSAFLRLV